MGGRGNRHVEHGLDRPALLDEVDRLDRFDHALAEPGGRETGRDLEDIGVS
jgi:hypothetical protein